jgi:hypothetical protein
MAGRDHVILARERIAELQRLLRDPQLGLSAGERQSLELEILRLQMLLDARQPGSHWEAYRFAWISLMVAVILMAGGVGMIPLVLQGRDFGGLGWGVAALVAAMSGVGLAINAVAVLLFSIWSPAPGDSARTLAEVLPSDRSVQHDQDRRDETVRLPRPEGEGFHRVCP